MEIVERGPAARAGSHFVPGLVCEALDAIQHRNNLPRSQDFYLKRGDLFLEYEPPRGTGFPQIYYLSEQK